MFFVQKYFRKSKINYFFYNDYICKCEDFSLSFSLISLILYRTFDEIYSIADRFFNILLITLEF